MKSRKSTDGRSKRKGSLEETISFALYSDDENRYSVTYRDKDIEKIVSLPEFLQSEDLAPIPLTRIIRIARDGKVVWRKGQKSVSVKTSFGKMVDSTSVEGSLPNERFHVCIDIQSLPCIKKYQLT